MKNKLLLTTMVLLLLLSPKVNFGQAPNLGTTADFALFTSVGAVSNAGTTYLTKVTGNVGTNSAPTITGFGNVDGQMHYGGDPASTQASADLIIAYGDISTAIPTFALAPLIGNGQILNAGVYAVTTPTVTLDNDLILDGQGDPSALFIIHLNGAFNTNANSEVVLINGAQACNVYWKVEGQVAMATETSMKGTLIVNNAAIDMATGVTLEGRALSTAGAITVESLLAYTPRGCGLPLLTGPLAPNLASMECYTIFSSDGPVDNVGITNVVGDVGTNNGTVTGFDPLLVVGIIHTVPDPSTVLAASDLLNAYADLNALPFDIELLFPAQFGHNLVLTPHTYIMNGAVTFTDTVFLNAEGNPNAVFVIQVKGAFATTTFSNVVMINGTKAENIYWMVDGAVSINDFSIFNGTIICNNGAMDLTNGVELYGRALTTTGALSTFAINATMPPGCGGTAAPLIITQPTDQTACNGDSVSFTVSATGTNLTYQWRIGTTNLVDGGNISGATTATLTINPATLLDVASNYNVVVTGDFAPSETSNNVSLTINPIATSNTNATICQGDSILIGGVFQNSPGIYTDTIVGGSSLGCDSVISTTLTVNPIATSNTSTSICQGDSILIGGIFQNSPGNYNDTIIGGSSLGCDSVISTTLTVNPIATSNTSTSICQGDSILIGGIFQNSPGNYNDTIIGGSSLGCDSVITITLTVNPIATSNTSASICQGDSILIGGVFQNTAGNYTDTIVGGSSLGCDSIITTTLTVNPIATSNANASICQGDSILIGGVFQNTAGIYTDTIVGGSSLGCDSVITTTLTVNPIATSNANAAICQGDSILIGGVFQNTAGIYTDTIVGGSSLGCDSVITTTLTVNPIATSNANAAICQGDSILIGGVFQNTAGIYTDTIVGGSSLGCDSVITTTLSVNPIATSNANATICQGDSILIGGIFQNTAGIYTDTIVGGSSLGCDSVITTTLTVTLTPIAVATSNSPICLGESINLNAATVSGSTYDWTGPNGFVSSSQNPIILSATNLESGIYTLTVTNTSCSSFSSSNVTVVINDCSTDTSTVLDFNIPEGFSPNNDGINDLFVIRGIDRFPANTFTIFNRWGDQIFEASPYKNEWDGKSSTGIRVGGDDLPVGTYFYLLDLGDGSEIYKGTIYLNK